ncbi:glycoside hydrolase family 3 protein [Jeotgalibaca sp. A122]|uniref:glycoside hydrolase family 3 protein n=1 Tax=Jeotgalibaca sp. A122 TaxID=3457322 RepID=UPI003FD627AD
MIKRNLFLLGTCTMLLSGCDGGTTEEDVEESTKSETSSLAHSSSDSKESGLLVSREVEILESMSLEEKVGQLFLARYPDVEAIEYAINYHLGGFIWFGKDFSEKTPEAVINEIKAIQEGADIDLFMAVDEEGGDVTRISSYPQYRSSPFLSPQQVFGESGWEGIESFALEQALLLKRLHFNLNLAPVVDIPNSPEDFIYHRAFSTVLEEVNKFSETFVSVYNNENMGTVLKHFPGYGSNIDTHTGVAYDNRSLDELWQRDLLPFQTGIDAGTEGVLVSHNVITEIDPDWPATLSPEVVHILRENMGFDGIIITDDLVMEGLQAFATPEEAAILAVLAGNDVLISSDFIVQMSAVLSAVEEGRISEKRLDESVLRILKVKQQLGLLQ